MGQKLFDDKIGSFVPQIPIYEKYFRISMKVESWVNFYL